MQPPLSADALPTGGQVVAGTGTIGQSGALITVTQKSSRLIADWRSFDIGAAAAVNFVQPNAQSVALNRVLGTDASQIEGKLSANGQVFLLNPNGVVFGKSSRVDVGGIVASTMTLSNGDFMAGRDTLEADGSTAAIVNHGTISAAPAGYVVLAAHSVNNSGAVTAPDGTVALVAAGSVTLALGGTGLVNVNVDAAALNALAQNSGRISAAGGQVLMRTESANALPGLVMKVGGSIEAHAIGTRQGHVYLDGGAHGDTTVTGTIVADEVALSGQHVEIAPTATIDVSAPTGGGLIEVGGGLRGRGGLPHATTVRIESGAKLLANATVKGNAGSIAVWSDGVTQVSGTLEAKGGPLGGNGGLIETSGHLLATPGIHLSAAAPKGTPGTWLLDPEDLTVTTVDLDWTASGSNPITYTSNTAGSVSTIANSTIDGALNAGTSVILATGAGGGDLGNITVSSPIAKSAGGAASLTLNASGSILVNAAISSTVGALAVTLDANLGGAGGYVNIQAPITTLGGDLVIGGGATPLAGPAVGTAVQPIGVKIAGALNAGGGNLTITGTGYTSGTNSAYGISISSALSTSGTGNLTLSGTGGGTGTAEIGLYTSANISAGTGNISITGSASSSATGSGNHGVEFTGGTTSTTGTGTITVAGTATGNGAGANSDGVLVSVSSVITAVNGLISITGTNNSTGSGSGNDGVYVTGTGSTINTTGTGGLTVLGFGGGAGAGGSDYGVLCDVANPIQATSTGAINMTGTGGDASGSGGSNYGVYANLSYATAFVTAHGGAILITGAGGNSSGNNNYGIYQDGNVSNTGTGGITLLGTGGGSGTGENGYYTVASNGAGTGNISITGNASGTATGSGDDGVDTGGGAFSTTGAGTITIVGTATGTGAGGSSYGVLIYGPPVSAVNGLISITGTNNSTGTGSGNDGVYIRTPYSTLNSTGTGGVTVLGFGGGSGAGGSNYGVIWDNASAIQSSSTGAISVTGTGGGAGSSGSGNYGVYANAALSGITAPMSITGTGGGAFGSGGSNVGVYINAALSSSAAVSITGTGGNSSGTNNYGISQAGAITTGASNITLLGTGGGIGTGENGYYTTAGVAAGTGNISITGTASSTATGSGDNGIDTGGGSFSTSGAGTITFNGTATGTGAGSNTYGVLIYGPPVSAVNGLISITGTNNSTGTGGGNDGVFIETPYSTVNSTGTGGVTVLGYGGGSGTGGSNYGVTWNIASAIQSSSTGVVSVTGTGGGAGGSGSGNYGVYANAALSGITAPMSITGTGGGALGSGGSNVGVSINAALSDTAAVSIHGSGGNSSGTNNYGISQAGAITTGASNITLLGTGGGSGTGEIGYYTTAGITAGTGAISITGNAGSTASGSGDHGVDFAGGTTSATGSGTITIAGTATGTAAGASSYGVLISGAIITAVNGLVNVTGTNSSTGTGSGNEGIYITGTGSVRSTGSGGVTVRGFGGGSGAGGNDFGVAADATNVIQASGAGAISITGTGGDAGGSGGGNYGVSANITGAGYTPPIFTAAGGALVVTGTGGNSSGAGNLGIYQAAGITNTGTGSIALIGTGGGTGAGESGYSLASIDGGIAAGTGNISVTGIASSTATGSSNNGAQFYWTVGTSGAGTVTIAGTATGTAAGASSYGVLVSNGTISAANGLISVTGHNVSTGTGSGNAGIYITNAGTIHSTGTGGVTVLGFGGGSGAGGGDYGVVADSTNAIQSTSTGAVSITGTGGDAGGSGGNNHGVYANITGAGYTPPIFTAAGGALLVNGTGGNSSGAGNLGINQLAGITNTGTGSITLMGTGGGTGTGEIGYQLYAIYGGIAAATGNISVTGIASSTATGSGNNGAQFSWTAGTSGAGTITIAGTATGSATGASSYGVLISGATITAVNGLISITGHNNSTGTGSGNDGIYITASGTVHSSGTGGVTLVGLGGGSAASANDCGVIWDTANAIQTTSTGAISITGNGGDSGGTGGSNDGVYATVALSGSGGAITITGTPGTSSGAANYGISLTSVAAGSATLTLSSSGAATASGALTAAALDLLGAGGSYVLTNAGNLVTTLAGTTGSVSYAQGSALSIGTVGGTAGLTSTGTVLVKVTGALTIASGAAVSAAGTGNALQLVDSTSFTNNAGAGALAITSGGGRWLVWSVAAGSDTHGGLVAGFIQNAATYGTTTPTDSVDNGFLYSSGIAAPVLTVSLTGSVSRAYNGTLIATLIPGDYTVTGANAGDVITITSTVGTYNTIHVGTGKNVTVTGLTFTATNGGVPVSGYTLSGTSAAGAVGTITAATVTAGLTGTVSKVYDSTLAATLAAGNYTLSGVLGSDVVTLNNPTAGSYDTIHVGTGKTVTVTGLTISGANASDYALASTSTSGAVGTITARPITVTAANQSRGYGLANPTLTDAVTSGSLAGSDTLTGTPATTATAASNVGSYAITQGTVAASSDYTLTFVNGTLTVSPQAITISASAGQSKVYGADDAAAAKTAYTLTAGTLYNGNTLTGNQGRAVGESVGSYAFTQGSTTVSDGNGGANYTITFNGSTNPFTITAAPLSASIANQSKVYGGNDPTLAGITATLAGQINRSVVDINGNNTVINDTGQVAATLASLTRAAGESVGARAISAATFNALSGTAAGNYSAPTFTGSPTLTITAAPLTASIVNQTKVYGADDPLLSSITATLAGVINRTVASWNGNVALNDTGLVGTTLASLTRAAGESIGNFAILAAAFALTGASAGDYSAPTLAGSPIFLITPASLTATTANQTKVYGADDPALAGILVTLTPVDRTAVTWNGSVPIDDTGNVSATVTGLTRAVGESVGSYAISGATLSALTGSAAANYSSTATFTGTPTLSITPASLTASIANQSKVHGADDPALGGITPALAGLINGTIATWNGAVTVNDTGLVAAPLASLTRPAGENVGTYNITAATFNALTGASAGNYAAPTFTGTPTLSITAAPLTASIVNQSKAYGADDPALAGIAATLAGLIDRSVATWNGGVTVDDTGLAAATLASLRRAAGENVGIYTITAATFNALSGGSAADYSAPTFTGTPTLSITPAPLMVSIVNQSKVYGADDPALAGIAATLAGLIDRTVATWNGAVAVDDTGRAAATLASLTRAIGEHVGSYTITAATFNALTGVSAGNYAAPTLSGTPTLSITAAPLTASIANQSKVYGADDPALAGIAATLAGLINRSVATWNGAVAVDDTGLAAAALASLTRAIGESVGSYIITAATLNALTGPSAADYSVPTFTGTPTLSIMPAPLTASIANQSKVYGADDPALTVIATTLAGLIDRTVTTWNGPVAADDTGLAAATLASLTRAVGESVGSYTVTAAAFNALTGVSAGNYGAPTFAGTPTLRITPAPLTASIANQSKVYGADDPALAGITATLGGLVNGTVATWNGTVTINDAGLVAATVASLTRAVGENVGGYGITAATFNALGGASAGNYAAPTLAGTPTLRITAAPLTASIANQTKVYGADDPALGGITPILGGLINGTIATWNGAVVVDDTGLVAATLTSLARAAGENVGIYGISAATFNALTGASAGNYAAPTFTGTPTLTLTASPLTGSIANQSKVYGADDPALAGILVTLVPVDRTAVTWNGNVLIDDTGHVSATVMGLVRAIGESVGAYAIGSATLSTPTGSAAGNYSSTATFTGTPTLSITPAPLTASIANQSKVYGADDTALAGIAPTLGGLINGTIATWNGAVTINDAGLVAATLASLTRAVGESVGSYGITAATFNALTGAAAGNYAAPTFTGTPTLSITPAPLTASIANQSKVYGADDTALAGIAPTLGGLINGTIATWNGAVTINDAGLVAATLASLTRAVGESVGSYGITAATFNALTGAAAGNYAAPTFTGTPTLSITPAPLTASIANQSKVYGADDPSLGGIAPTLGGLVNGTIATWNGAVTVNDTGLVAATLASLSRAVGENVGRYGITAATFNALTGAAAGNYSAPTFTGTPALSIAAAPMAVSIANQSKVYGADDPALAGITPILGGLINGTIATWNGAVTVNDAGLVAATLASLTRAAGENVGSYGVTAATFNALTGTAAGNYAVPTFSGTPTLSITPAPLTLIIANQNKVYGADDPALAGILVTLVPVDRTAATWNGGVPINDTGNVSATLTGLVRALGENVGASAISGATLATPTGSAAANYSSTASITGTPTLRITAAPLTASIANQTKVYGADDPALGGITPILGGLINGTIATWNGAVVVDDTGLVAATLTSLARAAGENVGIYGISAATFNALTGASVGNYSAPTFAGSAVLAIGAAQLSATFADQFKTFGGPDPSVSGIAVILTPVNRTVASWNGAVLVKDTGNVSATVTGLTRVPGESVGIYAYTGVTLSGLTGGAAANYINVARVARFPTLTITGASSGTPPIRLTVSDLTANDKVYDGTVTATFSGGELVGIPGGAGIVLVDGTGTFADKNVGTDKPVTASGFSLSGPGGSNYILVQPSGLFASITPAPLTVTAVAVIKPFDGNVSSAALPIVSRLMGGDSAVASETYGTAQVGAGKMLIPAAIVSDGNGGANYTLVLIVNTGGVITPSGIGTVFLPSNATSSSQSSSSAATNNPGPIPSLLPMGSTGLDGALIAVDDSVPASSGEPSAATTSVSSADPGSASSSDVATPSASSADPGSASSTKTSSKAATTGPGSALALSVGQVLVNTYSDGTTSNSTILAVTPRSISFSVPDTSVHANSTFPVADGNGVFAQATVSIANGQSQVSLDSVAAGAARPASAPQTASQSLQVSTSDGNGGQLQFGISGGSALTVTATNARAATVLGGRQDATQLNLALGRAIVDGIVKLKVGTITSLTVQTSVASPAPAPARTGIVQP